jgi:hypothetical protein
MDLHAVAVELHPVNPSVAGRHPLDRARELGLDEAGKRRLGADRGRFGAGIGHGSDQAHRQWKLDVAMSTLVAIDEVLQEERNVAHLQIAAPADLLRDVR